MSGHEIPVALVLLAAAGTIAKSAKDVLIAKIKARAEERMHLASLAFNATVELEKLAAEAGHDAGPSLAALIEFLKLFAEDRAAQKARRIPAKAGRRLHA